MISNLVGVLIEGIFCLISYGKWETHVVTMWGPFCLETVVNDKLEFRVFEISTRIVAGTNPFINGSPYAEMIYPGMSTGGRMALEIKDAIASNQLKVLMS